MLLTEDQKFFLPILRETGCLRVSQVLPLLRIREPGKQAHQAAAMLRGLCYTGQAVVVDSTVCLPDLRTAPPAPDRLLALDVLLALRPRQLVQLSARNPLYALCFLIQRREEERLDHFAFLRVPPGREEAVCQILQAEPVPYLFLLALHTPEQHSLIRITREHFFVLSQGSSLRFFRGKGGDNQQHR